MAIIGLFDRTTDLLQKNLDLRMQNQEAISANIANVDTPGYRAVHLEFEKGLQHALATEEAKDAAGTAGGGDDITQVQAKVVRLPDYTGIGDHNGVNLDQEMVDLAQNQVLYDAATELISKKLGLLRYVIQEGK